MKLNYYYIGIAILLYIIGQTAVWFQHNWQFKDPTKSPSWWGWYLMAIPLTFSATSLNPTLLISDTKMLFAFAL